MDTGTMVVTLGAAIGVAGGVVGTYCSISNTKSNEERSFMVKCSLWTWVLTIGFLCGLLMLPEPYNKLMWGAWVLVIVFGSRWMNNRSQELRTKNVAEQVAASDR